MRFFKVLFISIYLILMMCSCQNKLNFFGNTEQELQFSASIASPAKWSAQTKGTPLPEDCKIPSLGVFGYNTGVGEQGKWNTACKPQYIFNLEVENKSDAFTPITNVTWPKETDANATFFAYSPFASTKNGISIASDASVVGIPAINYSVPTTCEEQPDLMVSELVKDLNVKDNGESPVSFVMHHALTSIGFNGTGVGLIEKLTVIGVKTKGTLTTDESGNAAWQNLSGDNNLTVKMDGEVALTNESKAINSNDGYLMLIPQVLQNGAKLIVTLVGGKTIEFPLQGEWKAGEKIFYDINLFDLKLTDGYTIPNTFVGAFWKSNQIGERIIRIPFDKIPNAKVGGKWKAFVVWKDDKWRDDDIIFSTTPSLDRGITWDANTERPVNMSQYDVHFIVNGNQYTGVGTMSSNTPIYFRMGLKTKYMPTTDRPARYAIVAIVYEENDNFNYHFIYLRQGENPDYIMRNNEMENDFSDTSYRPNAKKFAVYNLTGEIDTQLAINGASFTDYPSQSGALFQWGNLKKKNYAFNPSDYRYRSWSIKVTKSNTFWFNQGENFNISPIGFKRPKDGATDKNVIDVNYKISKESFDVNFEINSLDSEFMQSLMAKLDTESDNAVFGYYADGFFDRRAINSNNCVAAGSAQIASIGKLFYNPKTYASVFFPTAGYREGEKGELRLGGTARYWSSCSYIRRNDTHRGLSMEMSSDKANFTLSYRSSACNIRCVEGDEEFREHTGGDDDDD